MLTKEERSTKYIGSCEYCRGTLLLGDRECNGCGAPVPVVVTSKENINPVGYYYGQPIMSSGFSMSFDIVTSGGFHPMP